MHEEMNLERLLHKDAKIQLQPSTEFLETLKRWLAVFAEHYRQEISELSSIAYIEGLKDLSTRQLNLCCEKALKSCTTMPVVSQIREHLWAVDYADLKEQYPEIDTPKQACEICGGRGLVLRPHPDNPSNRWYVRCECRKVSAS